MNQVGNLPLAEDIEGGAAVVRAMLPGGEESRVTARKLPITEGLWRQLRLAAFPVVLKMLLAANHHDNRLTTWVRPAQAHREDTGSALQGDGCCWTTHMPPGGAAAPCSRVAVYNAYTSFQRGQLVTPGAGPGEVD